MPAPGHNTDSQLDAMQALLDDARREWRGTEHARGVSVNQPALVGALLALSRRAKECADGHAGVGIT